MPEEGVKIGAKIGCLAAKELPEDGEAFGEGAVVEVGWRRKETAVTAEVVKNMDGGCRGEAVNAGGQVGFAAGADKNEAGEEELVEAKNGQLALLELGVAARENAQKIAAFELVQDGI